MFAVPGLYHPILLVSEIRGKTLEKLLFFLDFILKQQTHPISLMLALMLATFTATCNNYMFFPISFIK